MVLNFDIDTLIHFQKRSSIHRRVITKLPPPQNIYRQVWLEMVLSVKIAVYDSVFDFDIFFNFDCESISKSFQQGEGARLMPKLRNSTILILKGLLTAQISLSVLQPATMFRINFFCNAQAASWVIQLSEEIVK